MLVNIVLWQKVRIKMLRNKIHLFFLCLFLSHLIKLTFRYIDINEISSPKKVFTFILKIALSYPNNIAN